MAGARVNTLDLLAGHGAGSVKPGQTADRATCRMGRAVAWSLLSFGPEITPLEAFFISTGVVALGEMGDKTQLLALMLAARFHKPWPIVAGILVATLANHALAAAVGAGVAQALGPDVLRWVIGLSFLAMAAWMLVPDKVDEVGAGNARWGIFGTTVVAFFLAEMGDKTQIATVALAARYAEAVAVVAGTTLGMMLANVPAVFLGDRVARLVPMRVVHGISAALFLVLGLLTLFNAGRFF
jgi:Ca2+/H+ antiporter, TMEM165/GDT1 family